MSNIDAKRASASNKNDIAAAFLYVLNIFALFRQAADRTGSRTSLRFPVLFLFKIDRSYGLLRGALYADSISHFFGGRGIDLYPTYALTSDLSIPTALVRIYWALRLQRTAAPN
jgi:hypothetical protein